MQDKIQNAYEYAKAWLGQGKPADYIPELSNTNPLYLSVCATDLEGNTYTAGDCEVDFTLQSIVKVILLATALDELEFEELFSRVGMEPTGDPFNSILRLETTLRKPMNPMINAGAISVTASIPGENKQQRLDKILAKASRLLCCDNVLIDEKVYLSESRTGNKNRALAYMMHSNNIFSGDVEEHLDIYFKACALIVNCKSLSKFAAIIANDGIDPLTKQVVVKPFHIRVIRSLMMTCGLYDASGEFALRVGIPSKSGVGGGILSSVPKKMGIAVFSPSLDQKGNSLCGIKALEYLSTNENLSIF